MQKKCRGTGKCETCQNGTFISVMLVFPEISIDDLPLELLSSSNLSSNKNILELKELLAKNNIDDVFKKLKSSITLEGLSDELIEIEAQYSELKQQIRKRLIPYEDATIRGAKIRSALLSLINDL